MSGGSRLPHQATSDLCTQAAIRCLKAAGREPADVDLLVVATFTPDMAFPATANLIQDRLKLTCPAFDVQAACAGFVFALVIAAQFVATGNSQLCAGDWRRLQQPGHQSGRPEELPALWRRRRRRLVGAGRQRPGPRGLPARLRRLRRRPPEPAGVRQPHPPSPAALEKGLHYLTMDGRAVFKWAVRILADSALAVLSHADCRVPEIRWFIPHQANVRIIHAASDVLGFPREAVYKNLERFGNTSAGSIPIALDELCREGAIERGDLILTSGFGAGLNWGTALWRW